MKVALVADTHFGARSENKAVLDHMCWFFDHFFFPECHKRGVYRIIHLGDLVDRRKFVNYVTLKKLRDHFLEPAAGYGLDIIPGNHDSYYKNTLDVNAITELVDGWNVCTWTKPEWCSLISPSDPRRVLFLPWICQENLEASQQAIAEATDRDVCLAHLELKGFEMYRGRFMTHGMDSEAFSKFKAVFTGHFHTKSSRGNIHYLGAPYELVWTDYEDPRGFHVWDIETDQVEFVQNPRSLHHKVFYSDEGSELADVLGYDFSQLTGKFVKLVVTDRANQYWFEKFYQECDRAGPIEIRIVEDHLNVSSVDAEEVVTGGKEYVQILDEVIGESGSEDQEDLKRLMHELWVEAQAA